MENSRLVLARLMLLVCGIVYHFFRGNWEILLKRYNYLKLMLALLKYKQNINIREREGRLKERLKRDRIFLRFISSIKIKEQDFIFLNIVK